MKAIRMKQADADAAQARAGAAWALKAGVLAGKDSRAGKAPQTPYLTPQRSKHRAVKTTVGGERFDSKLEWRVWADLKLRQVAGEIRGLRRQVRFSLFMTNGEHYGIYTADFVYLESLVVDSGGARYAWDYIVADAKSPHTRKLPAWQKVKLLMKNCHGIDVLELP